MSDVDFENQQMMQELSHRLAVLEQRQWKRDHEEIVQRIERLELRMKQQERGE